MTTEGWVKVLVYIIYRLLSLVALPSLDGVLNASMTTEGWVKVLVYIIYRLLSLVDLPSLDGVLNASMTTEGWVKVLVYIIYRLLSLVDLPSLDGVLNEDSLDGGHILHNVTSMARAVGGACSSAAQRCLMAVGGAGGRGPSLAPPASHVTRQHPSHLFGTFSTRLHEHTTPRGKSCDM